MILTATNSKAEKFKQAKLNSSFPPRTRPLYVSTGFGRIGLALYLVADKVGRMVGVVVFKQKVVVDRPRDHASLEPTQPFQLSISGGQSPHGHGVDKVDIFRGRLLLRDQREGVASVLMCASSSCPKLSSTEGWRHNRRPWDEALFVQV